MSISLCGYEVEGRTMEAVREYLKALRMGRGISQDALADAVGLSRRAWINWENGETEDIKTGVMLKAIRAVQGAITDVEALADASIDEGIKLARTRLAQPLVELSAEQQQRLGRIANAVPDESVDEALSLLETLQRRDKINDWFTFGRFLKTAD